MRPFGVRRATRTLSHPLHHQQTLPIPAPPLPAGRDLFSALQRTGRGGTSTRVFGWWRAGARVAVEIVRGINYCHQKVRPGLSFPSQGWDLGAWCPAASVLACNMHIPHVPNTQI